MLPDLVSSLPPFTKGEINDPGYRSALAKNLVYERHFEIIEDAVEFVNALRDEANGVALSSRMQALIEATRSVVSAKKALSTALCETWRVRHALRRAREEELQIARAIELQRYRLTKHLPDFERSLMSTYGDLKGLKVDTEVIESAVAPFTKIAGVQLMRKHIEELVIPRLENEKAFLRSRIDELESQLEAD